ncbi:hypothetical protein ACEPAH_5455 [Sanghuangporus vaninii]
MNVIEDKAAGVIRDKEAGVHTREMKDIVEKGTIHFCIIHIGVVLRESPHKLWKGKYNADRVQEHIARGIQMREEAERERQSERRRRLKRLQAEGLAIRLGAREITPRDHSRGHRSHRHRDRRHGFTPIVTTANVGHGVSVPVAATTHAIPVARSASARTHHRHHSSGHSATAPLVHVHSRSHSGSATPVVQVAHSQYTSATPVAVSRAASSRHGHANEYYDDRAIPVARSSSRHGSSRYGDPALSRVSSSRHGHGHYRHARTHSRTPSEVYVAG